jgi:ubiquinone biosynthesis protein UbiJ
VIPGRDSGRDSGRDPGEGQGPAVSGLRVPDALLAAGEAALNGFVALDPEGALGFAPLYGRIIAIEVAGLGLKLTLIPGPDRIQLFGPYDAEPDCLIRGTPLALARLAGSERKESGIKSGEVEIGGDSAVAHDLAKAMAGLDVDWEEQLSRLLGDPLAHGVGQSLRAARDWGRQASDTLASDLKEYLEEEARLLPSRLELAAFLDQVDALRDDLERLAARVERLGARLAPAAADAPPAARE